MSVMDKLINAMKFNDDEDFDEDEDLHLSYSLFRRTWAITGLRRNLWVKSLCQAL